MKSLLMVAVLLPVLVGCSMTPEQERAFLNAYAAGAFRPKTIDTQNFNYQESLNEALSPIRRLTMLNLQERARQEQLQDEARRRAERRADIEYQENRRDQRAREEREFMRGVLERVRENETERRAEGAAKPFKVMLFGGENHKVYLGCLSCSEYEIDSLSNAYGEFGSKFGVTSIWNEFSQYGSEFSDYSPWNQFGQNPPIVVDADGNSYGYFTINRFLPGRTIEPALLKVLDAYEK